MASFTDAAELAAAACPLGEESLLPPFEFDELPPDVERSLVLFLCLLTVVPTAAPTTTPMMTRRATGMPNLIHGLVRFFIGWGVM